MFKTHSFNIIKSTVKQHISKIMLNVYVNVTDMHHIISTDVIPNYIMSCTFILRMFRNMWGKLRINALK